MLVMVQQNYKFVGCIEVMVFGFFYVENLLVYLLGVDIFNGVKGQFCFVSGSVCGCDGQFVVYVRMEVW